MNPTKYALFSLSNTRGAKELAAFLQQQGLGLLATSSTAQFLRQSGLKNVENISDFTGSAEILNGRVKTLHPKVHGSLLYLRDNPDHIAQSQHSELRDITVVVVNLYPFAQAAFQTESIEPLQESIYEEQIIENIDIGGTAMLRSAAKNYRNISTLCNPDDYADFITEWQDHDDISLKTKCELAAKVYAHTAHYDAMIASWFNQKNGILFPEKWTIAGERTQITRYGENPHQSGAVYQTSHLGFDSLLPPHCQQLHGKAMSYNNFLDADAALGFLHLFHHRAVIIIKHQNPCGSAIERHGTENLVSIYERALACDTVSAFGGIVAFSHEVDILLAEKIGRTFYEIILAPSYTEDALEKLRTKKNLRILVIPSSSYPTETNRAKLANLSFPRLDFRAIRGGFVVQQADDNLYFQNQTEELIKLRCVSQIQATEQDRQELWFAWKIASRVKSNAIVLSRDLAAPGIGAGQMSRIDAVKIAAQKMEDMGFRLNGCYLASDAFFPFRDTIDLAAQYGVRAIIQPGGSVRDSEVIQAADEHNIIMLYTGTRHFFH